MKKLQLIYEWIGPKGPISNGKIFNSLDIVESYTDMQLVDQGLGSIYNFLRWQTDTKMHVATPATAIEAPFIYECTMQHTKDWHANYYLGKGILENCYISPLVLNEVRKKHGYLMFSTQMESFLDDTMFSLMHRYFDTHNIPLSQIIYLTNSPNCKEVYERYCKNYNIEPELNCEYIGIWASLMAGDVKNSDVLMSNVYKVEHKSKTFLNFNRRYRKQRFWFLLEIFKNKVLDDFYISFDKNEPEGNMSFLPLAKDINLQMNVGLREDELHALNNMLPLVLDSNNFNVFPMEKKLEDTLYLYSNSLIHVVTETNFFTDVLHFSEKTFKAIIYKQPFIFVGPPHSLKYLKKFGFKTFSNLWDETYDEIEDHELRMKEVIKLITSIGQKSDTEKYELSCQIKDIVDYNFDSFINRRNAEVTEFVEKYGFI